MQVVWWIIFVISIIIFISLTVFVFPKIFFKADYEILLPYDRGLKNFKEKNGRSIIYEPKPEYQKYISQYILSERNGKKFFLSKINQDISYLDYDIVLFDCYCKVFKVVNVKENIIKHGYTNILELPSKTAYATLVINHIDNINVNKNTVKKAVKKRMASFIALIALLGVLEIFLIKLCIAYIFGDVFEQDFLLSSESNYITLSIGLIAILLSLAFAYGYNKLKAKRKRENSNRYEL